jgi:hypothetical protein
MSLSPTSTSNWGWKESTKSDADSIALPQRARLEKDLGSVDEDYVQMVSDEMIRKTSATVPESAQNSSTFTTFQKTTTDSVNGSERNLVIPPRGYERRVSGPWSRAFDVIYRH